MRYLVATHSQLILIRFNERWEVESHASLNTGHHYGIAPWKTADEDVVLVKQDDRELMVLDRQTLEPTRDPIPLSGETGAVHQIAVAHDGVFHANTDFNSVVYQTLDGKTYHAYHFEGKTYDYNHVNSVLPHGQQVYALLHNKGRTLTALAILDFDRNKGFSLKHEISIWDHGCHNAYVDATHLYYNASSEGCWVAVDLKKEEVVTRLSYPGHTKGLSLVDGTFVIGYSEHAERSRRNETKGYLAVIDQKTQKEIKKVDLNRLDLPVAVGNINEIRCIDGHDLSLGGLDPLPVDWSHVRLARRNPIFMMQKHLSLYLLRAYKKVVGNKKL